MTRFRFSLVALMGAVVIVAVGLGALRNASEMWFIVLFNVALSVLVFAIVGTLLGRGRLQVFCCGSVVCGWAYLVFAFGPWFQDNVQEYLGTTKLLRYLHPRVRGTIPPGNFPSTIVVWLKLDKTVLVDGQTVEMSQLSDYIQKLVQTTSARMVVYHDDRADSAVVEQVRVIVRDAVGTRSRPPRTRLGRMSMGMGMGLYRGPNYSVVTAPVFPSLAEFQQVGHSLFTLLIALVGGGLAMWLFGERGEPARVEE